VSWRGLGAPSLSHPPTSCPVNHEPCPRPTPPLLPHPPAFNRFLMPPCRHIRRRQNATFSRIPLPPSYSPATLPLPSCLSSKTSSSNLIAVAAATRDYLIGSVQQSMSSMHSPPRLVKALVSLVPIDYLPRICDLIFISQIFSPANVVFSGIGVLLMVSTMPDLPELAIMTLVLVRRLKTSMRAKMY